MIKIVRTPFLNALTELRPTLVELYRKGSELRTAADNLRARLCDQYGDRRIELMWTALQYSAKLRRFIPVISDRPNRNYLQHTACEIFKRDLSVRDQHAVKQAKMAIFNINEKMNRAVAASRAACPWTSENGYNETLLKAFLESVKAEALAPVTENAAAAA